MDNQYAYDRLSNVISIDNLAEAKKRVTSPLILKSMSNASQYLKPEVSLDILDALAMKMTDNQAAETLKKERRILFNQIFEQKKHA